MTSCTIEAKIDPKLRCAIRTAIQGSAYDIGEVIDVLEDQGFDDYAVRGGIEQMLYSRELLIGWPMSRVDLDSSVSLLALHVGQTTAGQLIEQRNHNPCRDVIDDAGRRELAWTLYVEEVDASCDVPPITTPYAERNLSCPRRPADCNIPYVPIIPPELIELVAWFVDDKLVDSAIRVRVD